MRLVRIATAVSLLIFMAVAVLFISGRLIINVTPSVPVGLWWVIGEMDRPFAKGDYVVVDVAYFSNFEAYADFPFMLNSHGARIPYLKRVSAIGGDVITSDGYGISVNGVLIKHSQILTQSSSERILTAFPLPLKLEDNQLWLMSHKERGFDSRYLGPVNAIHCRLATPIIVF